MRKIRDFRAKEDEKYARSSCMKILVRFLSGFYIGPSRACKGSLI